VGSSGGGGGGKVGVISIRSKVWLDPIMFNDTGDIIPGFSLFLLDFFIFSTFYNQKQNSS
jgi:hypothetical protein